MKALTHNGKFHADDVFGGAFLRIMYKDIEIIRSSVVPENFDGIVFDIGFKEFDHHQKDNETRPNGIPYAAFGKLWRHFAPSLYGAFVYNYIDKNLIQDLDLSDNTGSYNALALAISVFNPIDKKSSGDKEYEEALIFAKRILEKFIKKAKKYESETKIVERIYNESKEKEYLIFDDHYYFQGILPEKDTKFVIYPSNRGGFAIQGVPINSNTVKLKKELPLEWIENPPKYIKFCHKSRFLATTSTLKDAIYAVKVALR